MSVAFVLNDKPTTLNAPDDKPLLWALREDANLVGTKYGCGIAVCGACTVHVDGVPTRSCVTPCSAIAGKSVTTIEAIGSKSPGGFNAVQKAWIEHQVPQCGYCQSGFIMAATALLEKTPEPTDDEINAAITNLCRCGTYPAMRIAIKKAAQLKKAGA
ncbi:MAG: (2Fe-2S)-binding protein [Burkholderiales bacterium]|nr:MAG: (2Fe-2S)-binding protein [Betaproteobacteria bacterium]TAG24659.1 MAG: (2Fe-2S)-binding protein [Burkholderiales bacterium]TAG81595.1 MAG: (2Fe-2S)-binding protein [Burkholderiales bacterium]